MDLVKFINMVKVFQASGLMTPAFAVSVYLPVFCIGAWREAILRDLNPNANVQVVVHGYPDSPYLDGASLNTSLYDHELIFFMGSNGGREQFHFSPKGSDQIRLGDPFRFWVKPTDSCYPSGNPVLSGWWRMDGTSKRQNTTQKPWLSALWVIEHFCPKNSGVVDVTLGTGTTAMASMMSGRPCLGFDMCQDAVQGARQRVKRMAADLKAAMLVAGILHIDNDEELEQATNALQAIVSNDVEGAEEKAKLVDELVANVQGRATAYRLVKIPSWIGWGDELMDFYLEAWRSYCGAQSMGWVKRTVEMPDFDAWLLGKFGEILSIVNAARDAHDLPLLPKDHKITGAAWELESDAPPSNN